MHDDPKDKAPQPPVGEPKPVEEMSEEEQMEAYEESLKDTDWGHQPC
tara:strand:+ start:348 stop:488 length:141 start_codon:yes stop_codon:yes gene_type:complete